MELTPASQEALERIRRQYGDGSERSETAGSDPHYIGLPEQSGLGSDAAFSDPGGTFGTIGATFGAVDSLTGWAGATIGDGDAGTGEAEPDDEGALQPRIAAGTAERARSGSDANVLITKPSGIFAVPSKAEQAERSYERLSPDDIIATYRVSKDGGKVNVRFRNNKMGWVPTDEYLQRTGHAPTPGTREPAGEGKALHQERGNTSSIGTQRSDLVRGVGEKRGTRDHSSDTRATAGSGEAGTWSDRTFDTLKSIGSNAVKSVARGVLSETEAQEMHDDIFDATVLLFDTADKVIQATLVGNPKIIIWSDMPDADIEIIVELALKRARVDPKAAAGVRAVVDLWKYARIGQITIPRFAKTWEAYMMFGFEMPGGAQWKKMRRMAPIR